MAATRRAQISLRMATKLEDREEQGEAQRHHKQGPEHRGVDRRSVEPDHGSRLVQRVPQSTEKRNDRDVDEADQRDDRGGFCRPRGVIQRDASAQ